MLFYPCRQTDNFLEFLALYRIPQVFQLGQSCKPFDAQTQTYQTLLLRDCVESTRTLLFLAATAARAQK